MSSNAQFKHVNGSNGKGESICMQCLLAVGIYSSDEELALQESQHECRGEAEKWTLVERGQQTRDSR
jgi:hypothetical protein